MVIIPELLGERLASHTSQYLPLEEEARGLKNICHPGPNLIPVLIPRSYHPPRADRGLGHRRLPPGVARGARLRGEPACTVVWGPKHPRLPDYAILASSVETEATWYCPLLTCCASGVMK